MQKERNCHCHPLHVCHDQLGDCLIRHWTIQKMTLGGISAGCMIGRTHVIHSLIHSWQATRSSKRLTKKRKGQINCTVILITYSKSFQILSYLKNIWTTTRVTQKCPTNKKHQYANALWTVANSPNKFTEDKYSERFNAAQLRFSSFTRPIHSPLNAWLATAKVTKLKISPDGVSPDGGVVQSPELKSTENFLDWIGAEKDGIIALFSGTRGAEFQKIMSGLWNTTPVRDADARFHNRKCHTCMT